jgi:hypothetical protein
MSDLTGTHGVIENTDRDWYAELLVAYERGMILSRENAALQTMIHVLRDTVAPENTITG